MNASEVKYLASDIQYLALEGGGGKGIVYKGMIQALEEKGLLPIKYETGQIKGIVGSSAGAMTALALSMGMTLKDIENETTKEKLSILNSKEDVQENKRRSVVKENGHIVPSGENFEIEEITVYSISKEKIMKLLDKLWALIPKDIEYPMGIPVLVYDDIEKQMDCATKIPAELGYYCGFGARAYFTHIIQTYFIGSEYHIEYVLAHPEMQWLNAGTLTFKQFYDATKFDLRVTGCNTTTHLPLIFSASTTPNFPIAEAVGISMSIPFYFKPVEVGTVDLFNPTKTEILSGVCNNSDDDKKYTGFWVDGGMLNNLPIHAFDDINNAQTNLTSISNFDGSALNPNILAFRLQNGFDKKYYTLDGEPDGLNFQLRAQKLLYFGDKAKQSFENGEILGAIGALAQTGILDNDIVDSIVRSIDLSYLFRYCTDIFDTLMYPSEDGQLRTAKERSQTVELYTGFIGTMDFAPGIYGGIDITIDPIKFAREKTLAKLL